MICIGSPVCQKGHINSVQFSKETMLCPLVMSFGELLFTVTLISVAPQTIIEGSAGLVPPSQQEAATTAPYYPVTSSSVGPGPSGFPNPYGAEQAPMYLGTTVPAPPPQMNEQPQEQVNQEAGLSLKRVGENIYWLSLGDSALSKLLQGPSQRDFGCPSCGLITIDKCP